MVDTAPLGSLRDSPVVHPQSRWIWRGARPSDGGRLRGRAIGQHTQRAQAHLL